MMWLFAFSCQSVLDTAAVGSWSLVWEEQFDGAAEQPPDPTRWAYDVGGDGWGNNQLEYNSDRTSNVRLSGNSTLEIIARRETFEDNAYTSARINTRDRFEHGFGRYEARIKLPSGQGIWPAFWLLGASFEDGSAWPACGEIDILEMRGDQPTMVHGTIHGPGYSGGASIGGGFTAEEPLSDDFHVYRMDLDDQHISWYVDDELYFIATPGDLPAGSSWVFNTEYFMILNVAVGGNYLTDPDENTPFPNTMEVDYVKVYSRVE